MKNYLLYCVACSWPIFSRSNSDLQVGRRCQLSVSWRSKMPRFRTRFRPELSRSSNKRCWEATTLQRPSQSPYLDARFSVSLAFRRISRDAANVESRIPGLVRVASPTESPVFRDLRERICVQQTQITHRAPVDACRSPSRSHFLSPSLSLPLSQYSLPDSRAVVDVVVHSSCNARVDHKRTAHERGRRRDPSSLRTKESARAVHRENVPRFFC